MRQAKGRFLECGLKLTNQKSEQNLVWFDDNLRPYQRAERRLLVFRGHNAGFVAGLALHRRGMVSLEFDGPGAGEIKRHPKAETLLVTGDKRAELMREVLTCLMYDSSPLTGEDLGEDDTPPTALCSRPPPLNIPSESASDDNLAERTGVS
jgi:hypothetical protein